jgi:tetratricopeptide (TPR) repeat protein
MLCNLGDAYCIMEKFEEALECFEKVVKEDSMKSCICDFELKIKLIITLFILSFS